MAEGLAVLATSHWGEVMAEAAYRINLNVRIGGLGFWTWSLMSGAQEMFQGRAGQLLLSTTCQCAQESSAP